MIQRATGVLAAAVLLTALAVPAAARPPQVDISACRGMYRVLKAMRDGAPQQKVSPMLETLLDSPPYRIMFSHYNRSWRPNHLPRDVFKRMILSLQFEGQYSPGENERADAMRARWTKFYPALSVYESQLRALEAADLPKLIEDGVRHAQGWLPPGWDIPDVSMPIVPNGGSPAFTIENVQGYDFLQLSQGKPGELDLNWLVATVAHESHHLGMRSTTPTALSAAEDLAYRVVSLSVAEGVATKFLSGPPEGCAPVVPDGPFHVFTPELTEAWTERLAEEEDILNHQVALLTRAAAGELTGDALDEQLREYWFDGVLGRAYVLGADMFGAIYLAFGKDGVFKVMLDPRTLFEAYNAALQTRPEALKRCPRVPDRAVSLALALGTGARPPKP